ncbi:MULTISPECIES: hypothetical protein [Amycolatopsis]|uniref:Serine/threonine protein kinase n=1 Tax=Amycolatopsis albidoflavus TaxID=102226 RepID=A0ABW5HRW0_9PSEU
MGIATEGWGIDAGGPEASSGKSEGQGHKWLAAVGALLTGLAAVGITVKGCSGSDADPPTPRPSATQPGTAAQQSDTTQASAQPPSTAALEKRGDVTLTDGDQVDLEGKQVGKDVPNNDLSFSGVFPQQLIPSSGVITYIYSGATAENCRKELEGKTYSNATVDNGRTFCLRTVEGHIATVAIVKANPHENAPVQLKYTVWL